MLDAVLFQLGQQAMDFHRIGRGVRQRLFALGPDHADGAQAGGWLAQGGPDFTQEGDDRGFALGAGNGGNRFGLGVEKCRRITRQPGAGIFIGDESNAQRRGLRRHIGAAPARRSRRAPPRR